MMMCPQCENSEVETWIVHDETNISTDFNGKDWMSITQGNCCKECGHIWYEHYSGLATDFYWTND